MQQSLNYDDQNKKRAQSTAKVVYAKNPRVIRIDQNLYNPEYKPISFSQRFDNQEYKQINMPSRYNNQVHNLSQNNLKSSYIEKQVNLSVPYQKENTGYSFEDKKVIYGDQQQYSLELLKKFEELQKNLMQNPEMIKKTQQLLQGEDNSIYKAKSNINYINQINDLEDQIQILSQDNQKHNQKIEEQEQQIDLLQNAIQQKEQQIQNFQQELELQQDIRDKIEENKFIIEKLEAERDFHHKNHVELRKQLNNKVNKDFQVGQLQRDIHYFTEQQTDYQERIQDLEQQIKELLIFAEKPRNEKQNTYEQFYAKKIVDLENTIKQLTEENFELQNFNKIGNSEINLGFQSVQYDEVNDRQLSKLRNKISSQQKEIQTLKKKLQNQNQNESNNDNYQNSTNKLQRKIDQLQQQNTDLKQQNIELKTQLKQKEQEILKSKNQWQQQDSFKEQNDKLIKINKRLNSELKMLEQQLRKFERISKDQFYYLRNQIQLNKIFLILSHEFLKFVFIIHQQLSFSTCNFIQLLICFQRAYTTFLLVQLRIIYIISFSLV